jgi:hypothetical protein
LSNINNKTITGPLSIPLLAKVQQQHHQQIWGSAVNNQPAKTAIVENLHLVRMERSTKDCASQCVGGPLSTAQSNGTDDRGPLLTTNKQTKATNEQKSIGSPTTFHKLNL